jgi:hypothetical protein
MAKEFTVDTLVVSAENSGEAMIRFGEDYANTIDAQTDHVIIPGATHPFVEDGAMEKLFDTTVKWIVRKILQDKPDRE